MPRGLLAEYARDFEGGGERPGAVDPGVSGMLKNPGHGTGTLGILAGGRVTVSPPGEPRFDADIGAAPGAQVIPVRIANSVVMFRTSALARALDYALAPYKGASRDAAAERLPAVNVVSLSMGGVASAAWAEAVNAAYEAGICIVAAAGNNFSAFGTGVPTRFIVYPARFRRVIAACGVMADRRPYYGLSSGTMQGCWGPASKMRTALAAFTPNMPWAERDAHEIVDMNGAGTSSATPQIAGAAALYIAHHRAALAQLPHGWQRVEAVRQALFSSADKSADGGSNARLGNGILRAAAALAIAPSSVAERDAGRLGVAVADQADHGAARGAGEPGAHGVDAGARGGAAGADPAVRRCAQSDRGSGRRSGREPVRGAAAQAGALPHRAARASDGVARPRAPHGPGARRAGRRGAQDDLGSGGGDRSARRRCSRSPRRRRFRSRRCVA